jgi:hypothetical protein
MMFSKYKAVKTIVDGKKFDSKKEAKRYQELKLLEQSNEIKELQLQVPFILIDKSEYGRVIKYIADFVYIRDGKQVVEDCKGFRTDVYRLKKRLFEEKYKTEIFES